MAMQNRQPIRRFFLFLLGKNVLKLLLLLLMHMHDESNAFSVHDTKKKHNMQKSNHMNIITAGVGVGGTATISSTANKATVTLNCKRQVRKGLYATSSSTTSYDNGNDNNNNNSSNNNNVVLIIDWECLLQDQKDLIEYRIMLGIQAAFQVWPELQSYKTYYQNDLSWLQNKLKALAHVFCSNNNNSSSSNGKIISSTCNYALATRMLLEEQELDQGESVGKNGKYAKKFHPRTTTTATTTTSTVNENDTENNNDNNIYDDDDNETEMTITSTSSTGTRPLTVGEIAVNWNEFLRETLQMKYSIQRKDPLPILQEAIDDLLLQHFELLLKQHDGEENNYDINNDHNDSEDNEKVFQIYQSLVLDPRAVSILFSKQQDPSSSILGPTTTTIFLTTSSESDQILLQNILQKSNIQYQSIPSPISSSLDDASQQAAAATTTTTTTKFESNDNETPKNYSVFLLDPTITMASSKRNKSLESLQSILKNNKQTPSNSKIIIIESSWDRLKNYIPLFGDSIPRRRFRRNGSIKEETGNSNENTNTNNNNNNNNNSPLTTLYNNNDDSSLSSSSLSVGSCILSKNKTLSLALSDWTKYTSHPTHEMEATMNPWTQTIAWEQFMFSDDCIPQPPAFQ